MLHGTNRILITGNKKDFPSCVFDTVGIICIEEKSNGSIKPFTAIRLNYDKFDDCYEKLQALEDQETQPTIPPI